MVEPENVPVGPQIDENTTASAGGGGHFLRYLIRGNGSDLWRPRPWYGAPGADLFLAQATVVYGQSMEPNLHPNQRLIVEKFSYRLRAPALDDIVVVDCPDMEEMLVKAGGRTAGRRASEIRRWHGLCERRTGARILSP